MPLQIGKWIRGWRLDLFFSGLKSHLDKIAVTITEAVKTAADNTVVQTVSAFIDDAFKTHIAEDAIKVIQAAAIKALAIELAIQGLPDNPTTDDINNFEAAVFKAITDKDPYGKSKFYTNYAAQLYTIIKTDLGQSVGNTTFAEIAKTIEDAYQAFKADQAQEDTNP